MDRTISEKTKVMTYIYIWSRFVQDELLVVVTYKTHRRRAERNGEYTQGPFFCPICHIIFSHIFTNSITHRIKGDNTQNAKTENLGKTLLVRPFASSDTHVRTIW